VKLISKTLGILSVGKKQAVQKRSGREGQKGKEWGRLRGVARR